MSEELQDVVDEYDSVSDKDEDVRPLSAKILIGEEVYECSVKKITRKQNNTFKFKAKVPKFSIKHFIDYEDVKIQFHNDLFTSKESPFITYSDSGILTFTARRILKNEKV